MTHGWFATAANWPDPTACVPFSASSPAGSGCTVVLTIPDYDRLYHNETQMSIQLAVLMVDFASNYCVTHQVMVQCSL